MNFEEFTLLNSKIKVILHWTHKKTKKSATFDIEVDSHGILKLSTDTHFFETQSISTLGAN